MRSMFILLISLSPWTARAAAPCESLIEPRLGRVDETGKVTTTDDRSYTVARDPRAVTIRPKYPVAQYDYKIRLDDSGRATEIERKHYGFIFDRVKVQKVELGYRDGKCFVQRISLDDQLFADVQMCRELIDLYRKMTTCANTCELTQSENIRKTLDRYHAKSTASEMIAKVGKLKLVDAADTDATVFMNNCANTPSIAATLGNDKFWRARPDADGDGKTAR